MDKKTVNQQIINGLASKGIKIAEIELNHLEAFADIMYKAINVIQCCKSDSEQLKVLINKDIDVDLLGGFKARLIGFRPEQFEVVYNHNDAVDWVNTDEVSVKNL